MVNYNLSLVRVSNVISFDNTELASSCNCVNPTWPSSLLIDKHLHKARRHRLRSSLHSRPTVLAKMLKICFQIAKMNQPSDKASNFLIIAMVILVAMVITDAMVMHAGNGGQRGQDRQDRHLNFTFQVTGSFRNYCDVLF